MLEYIDERRRNLEECGAECQEWGPIDTPVLFLNVFIFEPDHV